MAARKQRSISSRMRALGMSTHDELESDGSRPVCKGANTDAMAASVRPWRASPDYSYGSSDQGQRSRMAAAAHYSLSMTTMGRGPEGCRRSCNNSARHEASVHAFTADTSCGVSLMSKRDCQAHDLLSLHKQKDEPFAVRCWPRAASPRAAIRWKWAGPTLATVVRRACRCPLCPNAARYPRRELMQAGGWERGRGIGDIHGDAWGGVRVG